MPNADKALEKSIRSRIREINKKTGAGLSFAKLHTQINAILKTEDPRERGYSLLIFNAALTDALSEKLFSLSALYHSTPSLAAKHAKHPAMGYSITEASADAKDLTKQVMQLIDPAAAESFAFSNDQLDVVYENQKTFLLQQNYYDQIPNCLQEWDYKCYREDMANIENALKEHNYGANPADSRDMAVMEGYRKVGLIRDELSRHGAIWRFFNFRKVAACQAYMQRVEAAYHACGFDPEQHGSEAERFLKETVIRPLDQDLERIRNERDSSKVYPQNEEVEKEENKQQESEKEIVQEVKQEEIKQEEAVEENQAEIAKEDFKKAAAKEIDDEVRRFGDEMFKIDFRPAGDDIQSVIDNMNAILPLMRNNAALTASAKRVFNANRNKIAMMKSAIDTGADTEALNQKFDEVENILKNEKGMSQYKPVTVAALEKGEAPEKDEVSEQSEEIKQSEEIEQIEEKIEENKEIADDKQVEEINNGEQVEEINNGEQVEEINNGEAVKPIEEIEHNEEHEQSKQPEQKEQPEQSEVQRYSIIVDLENENSEPQIVGEQKVEEEKQVEEEQKTDDKPQLDDEKQREQDEKRKQDEQREQDRKAALEEERLERERAGEYHDALSPEEVEKIKADMQLLFYGNYDIPMPDTAAKEGEPAADAPKQPEEAQPKKRGFWIFKF